MKYLDYLLKWLNLACITATLLTYVASYVNPQLFWPMAVVGLFFPFLILSNLLFMAYWAIRWNRYFFFSLVTVIIGWGQVRTIVGLTPPEPIPAKAQFVKLTTFNAHNLIIADSKKGQKGKNAYNAFYHFLKSEKSDLYCFQELTSIAMVKQKVAAFNNDPFFKHFKTYEGGGNIFLYTRLKVLDHKVKYFDSKRTNGYLQADIQMADKVVRVINIHLESNQISEYANNSKNKLRNDLKGGVKNILSRFKRGAQKRATQAQLIADLVRESPYPVIVSGDLNDVPQSYSYRTISANLDDPFRYMGYGWGFTYAGSIPALRIDYFFCDPALQYWQIKVGERNYSDHRPVSCIIKL